ncbi:Werner syndrome ATP-dependent helicase homolog [Rosa chinensis]|uniref:Werner syndrome ATP-dependent helicase homolog n=1 Tax=Rosa chinensis TaxID=74649 RepID=UPI000D0886E6|nr:Werner syndrome ATP-dependent helicase homolog [Rosa chinensis]
MADSDHKLYHIEFYEDCITTTVTGSPHIVDQWVNETYYLHGSGSHEMNFFVGLDTEWRFDPEAHDYQVAIIQLCDVRRRCLIFQFSQQTQTGEIINNAPPHSLTTFLADQNISFVGKQVKEDVKRLARLGLHVSRAVDVSHMAAEKYRDKSHRCKGLKTLAMEFLNKEMNKHKDITLSRWDVEQLSLAQVEYACIDAFVSLRLGILLSTTNDQLDHHHPINDIKQSQHAALSS